jgi:hypothetical protein
MDGTFVQVATNEKEMQCDFQALVLLAALEH